MVAVVAVVHEVAQESGSGEHLEDGIHVAHRAATFIVKHTRDDMRLLCDLMASGELRSVIDTVSPLSDTADALRHLETGHASGKIVVMP